MFARQRLPVGKWIPTWVMFLFALAMLPSVAMAQGYDELTWSTTNRLGWDALEDRQYRKARDYFRRAVQLVPKDFRYGESKTGLAWAYHRLGDHPRAVAAANEAYIYTNSAKKPKELQKRASLLHLLGRLRCCERSWDDSRKFFQRSEKIYEAKLNEKSKDRASLLISWAELEKYLLNYDDAKKKLKIPADDGDYGIDPQQKIQIYLSLADISIDLGNYVEADGYLNDSAKLGNRSDPPSVMRIYLLGRLAFLRGQYLAALQIFDTLQYATARCDQAHCTCRNRIYVLWARSLVALGEFEAAKAKLALLRGTQPWEQNLHQSYRHVVAAEVAFILGEYADAVRNFSKALRCREIVYSKQDPGLCHILLGLANTLEHLGGTHSETPKLCSRVRQIYRNLGNQDHPDVAESQVISARNELYLGRASDAEKLFARDALGRFVHHFPQHPKLATALDVLAKCLWAQPDSPTRLQEARDHLKRAHDMREKHVIDNSVPYPSPIRFSQGETELIRGWIQLCAGDEVPMMLPAEKYFLWALQHFRAGDRIHPLDANARLGLFLSRGRVDQNLAETAEHYLIMRLGKKSTAYFYACRGDLCRRYGRAEDARWLLNRALDLYQQCGSASDIAIVNGQLDVLTRTRQIIPLVPPAIPAATP